MFARLCDVDDRGRSTSVCDGLIRHETAAGQGGGNAVSGGGGSAAGVTGREEDDGQDTARGWSALTVPMSAIAHRFAAGHRIRLTLAGGAHPRFARNTGTGEPIAAAVRLSPVDIEFSHDADPACGLSLPVVHAGERQAAEVG